LTVVFPCSFLALPGVSLSVKHRCFGCIASAGCPTSLVLQLWVHRDTKMASARKSWWFMHRQWMGGDRPGTAGGGMCGVLKRWA